MDSQSNLLKKETILRAFELLNRELANRDLKSRIYLVGGAVMCLVHHARPSTKDVDGWFTEPQVMREAAAMVAQELAIQSDWLNDAAKGFIPQDAKFEKWKEWSHLEVLAADNETLLSMKCLAARGLLDSSDIRFLINALGLKKPALVMNLITKFYPKERIPFRTQLLVEEVFDGDSQASD